jgi:P2-related tail formation protein
MNSRPVASGIENVWHMMALIDATAKLMAEYDISAVLVQLIRFAPPQALPYLAAQFNVLGLRGYAFCDTDDQRRTLLENAAVLNRLQGTPASIELAVKSIGYDNCIVTERTGIKHNGLYKHNGVRKHGGTKWYNINVEVFYSGAEPTDQRKALIAQMINIYKAERSVLLELKFTLTV